MTNEHPTKTSTKKLAILAISSAIGIALLFISPLIGLIVIGALLAVVPPWGRTLSERAFISGIVLIGTTAIAFPRAGGTPIDATSAKLFFAGLLIAGLALYAIPQLRNTPIPRPRITDGALLALFIVLTYWLIAAYLNISSMEIVSGLFFSGWDNQAHFTTFANTYSNGSTTWTTTDGTIAWNQWYPSLHSTVWALAQYAAGTSGLTRVDLLFPYVQWSAVSFALSVTALAWVASDLAGRWARTTTSKRAAQVATFLAAGGTGAWILFGSPQLLFNSGFTNFTMAVAIVSTTSYISIRSTRSARTLGWFLIPLAAIAVIGLWTPLAIGLIPAGVIVAVSLIRWKAIIGIAWLVLNAVVGLLLAWQQLGDILAADDGSSAADFATSIGSVPTGMAPFNIGAAIAAPFVAITIAVMLRRNRPLAFGVAGPAVFTGILAIAFIPGTDAAGTSRIQSYYVLKALDAALLSAAPLIAAALAVGLMYLARYVSTITTAATVTGSALVGITAFGYVGSTPNELSSGFTVAPGIEAGRERVRATEQTFVGDQILGAVRATADLPEFTPIMWDGPGILPNLWVATLHSTFSADQQTFILSIPGPPYGEEATDYVKGALTVYPNLKVGVVWTSSASESFVKLRLVTVDPRRVVLINGERD